MDAEREAFAKLVAVCRRLRGPGGCPWDREQTLESMTPYLQEEAAEAADAIAQGRDDEIAEELGDLGFLALFCLELLAERGRVGTAEALDRTAEKLIRRHPHVYGEAQVSDGDHAYRQWQQIKQGEQGTPSLLGDQPRSLPALVAAYRIQEKAGAVGFDWPDVKGTLEKVREEAAEIHRAVEGGRPEDQAREVGDLLFAVVNLARHLGVDPERELRGASRRFRERFHHIEKRLAEQGKSPSHATLEEMEALWQEAKSVVGDPRGAGAPGEQAPEEAP
jgi:MazG family protein